MIPAIVPYRGKGAVLANPYSVIHTVRLFAQFMLVVIATCMPESPTYSLYENLASGSARIAGTFNARLFFVEVWINIGLLISRKR
jgi:hypothetical protein